MKKSASLGADFFFFSVGKKAECRHSFFFGGGGGGGGGGRFQYMQFTYFEAYFN